MGAQDAAGMAALSICESLLIALVEKGVLGVEEARGVLEDAAAAHCAVGRSDPLEPQHARAAQAIERLITQMGAIRQSGGQDG